MVQQDAAFVESGFSDAEGIANTSVQTHTQVVTPDQFETVFDPNQGKQILLNALRVEDEDTCYGALVESTAIGELIEKYRVPAIDPTSPLQKAYTDERSSSRVGLTEERATEDSNRVIVTLDEPPMSAELVHQTVSETKKSPVIGAREFYPVAYEARPPSPLRQAPITMPQATAVVPDQRGVPTLYTERQRKRRRSTLAPKKKSRMTLYASALLGIALGGLIATILLVQNHQSRPMGAPQGTFVESSPRAVSR